MITINSVGYNSNGSDFRPEILCCGRGLNGLPGPATPWAEAPQSFYDAIRDKAANLKKIAPEPSDLR